MVALIVAALAAVGAYAIGFVFFTQQSATILISHLNYREAVALAVFIIVLRGYGSSK